MELKYFEVGRVEKGYGDYGILLGDVFSVSEGEAGNVVIYEECDGYFMKDLPREEAIGVFEEAIAWIRSLEQTTPAR